MFGEDDGPVIAPGPKGEVDGIWYEQQDHPRNTATGPQLDTS